MSYTQTFRVGDRVSLTEGSEHRVGTIVDVLPLFTSCREAYHVLFDQGTLELVYALRPLVAVTILDEMTSQ